jgi:putative hydrolase of the HAD superfamily
MAAVKAAMQTQLKISGAQFDICYEQARSHVKRRLGQTASSHSRLLYFQRVLELIGLGSQPANALLMQNIYWREFLSTSELFPEAEDFLDDLRIAGIPIVIVTDLTADIQMRKMLHWDLGRFIDYLVTSEESGQDKPAPEIFELALAKLGGVEGQIWMIGDSVEKDIIGAKRAVNAMTFLRQPPKTRSKSPRVDELDMTFTRFQKLRQILNKAL